MSAEKLPAALDRLLPPGFTRPQVTWLVDGLVAEGEVTAFAVSDTKARAALGIQIARGLLAGTGSAAGREIRAAARPVVVLTTSRFANETYRLAFPGETRVSVGLLKPWTTGDSDYFPSLDNWTASAGAQLVVVDCVQDIPNGASAGSLASPFERFGRTVVAMYRGNEKLPGVGGEMLWSAAAQKFWHEPKTGLLYPVDARTLTDPWAVDLSLPPLPVSPAVSPEAEKVRRTGVIAVAHGATTGADPGSTLSGLLASEANALANIWGKSDYSTILPALSRHRGIWDAVVAGRPVSSSDPTEPDF